MAAKALSEIPTAYATPSLGLHPAHTLPLKLRAAADAKFTAVEIGIDDLIAYARSLTPDLPPPHPRYHPAGAPALEPDPVAPSDEPLWTAILAAAGAAKALCAELALHVLALAPLAQYEGWPAGTARAQWAWARAARWLEVARELGAEMVQVGSNNEMNATAGVDGTVADMTRLADRAAELGVKVAYEPWCWGAYVNTWEGCWEIVRKANHPNLGLCLDTFQIAGSPVYGASPTTPTGWIADYTPSILATSLRKLTTSVPASKIFYLQISDGARLDPPLGRGSALDGKWTSGWEARAVWSGGARPLPFKLGGRGYLPVVEVTEAVLATGFRGYLSYEPFEAEQEADDPGIPERYALEGRKAHQMLMAAIDRRWRR